MQGCYLMVRRRTILSIHHIALALVLVAFDQVCAFGWLDILPSRLAHVTRGLILYALLQASLVALSRIIQTFWPGY